MTSASVSAKQRSYLLCLVTSKIYLYIYIAQCLVHNRYSSAKSLYFSAFIYTEKSSPFISITNQSTLFLQVTHQSTEFNNKLFSAVYFSWVHLTYCGLLRSQLPDLKGANQWEFLQKVQTRRVCPNARL